MQALPDLTPDIDVQLITRSRDAFFATVSAYADRHFHGDRGAAESWIDILLRRKRGETLSPAVVALFEKQSELIQAQRAADAAQIAAFEEHAREQTIRANVEALRGEVAKYEFVLAGLRAFVDAAVAVGADHFLGFMRSGPTADKGDLLQKAIGYGRDLAGARVSAELIENDLLPEFRRRLSEAESELATFTQTLQAA